MKKLPLISLLILWLLTSAVAAGEALLEIAFIDVGAGDAILLKDQSGKTALIDTGPPQAREKLIAWLAEQNVRELNYLIITHPHADHLGNAVSILSRFPAARLGDNGQKIDSFSQRLTEEMVRDYEKNFRGREKYVLLKRGDEIKLGEASIKIVWPRDTTTERDWNTNSLVMMLSCGELRALLAGDLNEAGEKRLREEKDGNLKAHLLKIGHHGSRDAATEEFLQTVSPRWAIISVGENPWGYPSTEVFDRLQKLNIRSFRTDRDGSIIFRYFSPGNIEIYTRNFSPLLTRLRGIQRVTGISPTVPK